MNYVFFFWGGGGGGQGVRKINLWRFDEIMIFCSFWVSFLSIWGFFKVKVQIWKMFLGLLNFKYVLGVPDIPYIFGGKE